MLGSSAATEDLLTLEDTESATFVSTLDTEDITVDIAAMSEELDMFVAAPTEDEQCSILLDEPKVHLKYYF